VRRWGGRFAGGTDERVIDFTRSIEIDAALAADDIEGSIAHVRGLGRAGILAAGDVGVLVDGLRALAAEVEAGTVTWDPALEDVHMNLEAMLEARIGPVARKLHTGRSRNDQVATDLRLDAGRSTGWTLGSS
jgi:argininosuccinate lyase